MMLEIPYAVKEMANRLQKVLSNPRPRRAAKKQNAAAVKQHATCRIFENQDRRGSASSRNAAICTTTSSHAADAIRRLIIRSALSAAPQLPGLHHALSTAPTPVILHRGADPDESHVNPLCPSFRRI